MNDKQLYLNYYFILSSSLLGKINTLKKKMGDLLGGKHIGYFTISYFNYTVNYKI